MFVEITNDPREYDWGSTTVLPELLGRTPNGNPQAEFWLGTHPGSPARLARRSGLLSDVAGSLPFLVKVLAASRPLSLQAHPDAARAATGFARENAFGIPLAAAERTYKDPSPKPELLYALDDGFRALCGFRHVAETRDVLAEAGHPAIARLANRLVDDTSLRAVVAWLLAGGSDVTDVVDALVAAAHEREGSSWEAIRIIAASFPRDPAIAVSVLLHATSLAAGEALFLGAGRPHAYLSGVGVEVMVSSDNVLRGGMTSKHIDVPELLEVLDFEPGPVPVLAPTVFSTGVRLFRPPDPGFQLVVVTPDGLSDGPLRLDPEGPAIALCLEGSISLARGPVLGRGSAVYVEGEGALLLEGRGTVYLAAAAWRPPA